MPNPLISIIIPVYNAEAYIEQCIRSVLSQTINDIEIIAVNDGSTDNSKVLLDQLAAQDQRLHVFHRSKKGVSASRNFGLQKATGSYIGFCDADDFMDPTMLEELYNAIQLNKADWAICNVRILGFDGSEKTRLKLNEGVVNTASDKASEVEKFMLFIYDYANWNKLFSSAIIREKKLQFDESMFLWEDLLFNLVYLQFSNKLTVINIDLYHYRVQSASLTNTHKEELIPHFNVLYSKYKAFIKDNGSQDQWITFQLQMARGCYNQVLYQQAVEAKRASGTYLHFLFNYYKRLKAIDPEIFYYPKEQLIGFQGFKKKLLIYKLIFPFSVVVVAVFFAKGISKVFRSPLTSCFLCGCAAANNL